MKLKVSSHCVYRELDGELVMLNLVSGRYFTLDEIGTRMWNLLIEGRSTEEVVEAILADYDSTPDQVSSDLSLLLEQLRANDLLIPDP